MPGKWGEAFIRKNKKHTMEYIGLSAFSVFCTQCPSKEHKTGPTIHYHSAITGIYGLTPSYLTPLRLVQATKPKASGKA